MNAIDEAARVINTLLAMEVLFGVIWLASYVRYNRTHDRQWLSVMQLLAAFLAMLFIVMFVLAVLALNRIIT